MPFKLRLKKSRHYSVVSKSLFIISVEALDNTTIECTLSSESTGQECLECACQKLSINQPHFFGLQYQSREPNTYCWLEMDRPVKRQLEKHSGQMQLRMRVLFYVHSGTSLISDELARYHYFLQLKLDVIEGKIVCNPKQAVQLASYCMQAEFGNYDAEKHTPDYLKDFHLFPKNITDPMLLDSLTNAAIHQHAALHNLPQGDAEEHFITACQHLDGYGVECYRAIDEFNKDVIVGVSLNGIVVRAADGYNEKFYAWVDVNNVVNHKKTLSLECAIPSDSKHFQFPNVDTAKKCFRMAVLQNTFSRKYESTAPKEARNSQIRPEPAFHQTVPEDRIELDLVDHHHVMQHGSQLQLSQRAQSTSCLDLSTNQMDVDRLRTLLPSYRPAPDYETAIQQKYRNSAGALPQAAAPREQPRPSNTYMYSSQPEIHQPHRTGVHYPDVTHGAVYTTNAGYNRSIVDIADGMHLLHLYKAPPPYPSNRLSSNSTPDLAVTSQVKPQALFVSNQVSGSSPDLVSINHHYLKQCGQLLYQPQSVSQNYLPVTQQHTHGTYENLASIFDNRAPAVLVEEPRNIIYCMAGNFISQKVKESEPIYENIPVGWQGPNDEGRIRSRTQSIQSAPEVITHLGRENLYVNLVHTSNNNIHNHSTNVSTNNISHTNLTNTTTTNNHSNNNLNEISFQVVNNNSSTNNLTDSSSIYDRSNHLANSTQAHSDLLDNTTSSVEVSNTDSLNRKNTFTVKKVLSTTVSDSGNSTAETADLSATSSSTGKKRRRWGLLVGRKSGEKEKSATLGREKKKSSNEETRLKERHRWSTGLPRLQPLPPTISKETMCQLLEQKLSDSQLFFEFDKIPKKRPQADFTTALHPYNAQFNRFKDVLPYEDNRVKLTPTRDNKFGYINASHITATVGSKQRFYIAAQGPTTQTLANFWHCVWESEVYLIVQLTDNSDDLNYLPQSSERCVDIGQYQVWCELSQRTGHCVTSKMRLDHVNSRRYRALWHLHYTDWGEQGCPHSVAHYLGFLEELRSVRQHTMDDIPPGHNRNPPVLVHCTAGVGRTGLTILADLLLYTLDHNQELNVPRVVVLLRHQRAYMVQTIAQYRFVYTLLIHYLKQTRLI